MIRQPTELERRVAITQATLDAWKGRAFNWKKNSHCIRMAADHLRRMGYTPPLSKAGPFNSALGATRALKRMNIASVAEAVDLMGLPAIQPAAAWVGDIVELPGEAPFSALTIALGNGRVLGFHEDAEGAIVLQPIQYVRAWRVTPHV